MANEARATCQRYDKNLVTGRTMEPGRQLMSEYVLKT